MPNLASPGSKENTRKKILTALNLNREINETELLHAYQTLEGYICAAERDLTLYIDILIEFLCLQDKDIIEKFFDLLEKKGRLTESLFDYLIARLSDPENDVSTSRISEKVSGNLKLFLMEKWIDINRSSQEIIRENLEPHLRDIFLLLLNNYMLIGFLYNKEVKTTWNYLNLTPESVEHFKKIAINYLEQIANRGCKEYMVLMPEPILIICMRALNSIIKQNPISSNDILKTKTLTDGSKVELSYTQIAKFLDFLVNRLFGAILDSYSKFIKEKCSQNMFGFIDSLFKEEDLITDLKQLLNNPTFLLKPTLMLKAQLTSAETKHPIYLAKLEKKYNKIAGNFQKALHLAFMGNYTSIETSQNNKKNKQEKKEDRRSLTFNDETLISKKAAAIETLRKKERNMYLIKAKDDKTIFPNVDFAQSIEKIILECESAIIYPLMKLFFQDMNTIKIVSELQYIEKVDDKTYEKGVNILLSAISQNNYELLDNFPTNDPILKTALKEFLKKYNLAEFVDYSDRVTLYMKVQAVKIIHLVYSKINFTKLAQTLLRNSPVPLNAISNNTFSKLLELKPIDFVQVMKEIISGPLLNDLPEKLRKKIQNIFVVDDPYIVELRAKISIDNIELLTTPFDLLKSKIKDIKYTSLRDKLENIYEKYKKDTQKIQKKLRKALLENKLKETISKLLKTEYGEEFLRLLITDMSLCHSKLGTYILWQIYQKRISEIKFDLIAASFSKISQLVLNSPSLKAAGHLLDISKRKLGTSVSINNSNNNNISSLRNNKDEEGDENEKNENNNNVDSWDKLKSFKFLYKHPIKVGDKTERFDQWFSKFGMAMISDDFFNPDSIFFKKRSVSSDINPLIAKNLINSLIYTNEPPSAMDYATALSIAIDINAEDTVNFILTKTALLNINILTQLDCCNNLPLNFALRNRYYNIACILIRHCIISKDAEPVTNAVAELQQAKDQTEIQELLGHDVFFGIDFNFVPDVGISTYTSPSSSMGDLGLRRYFSVTSFHADVDAELNKIRDEASKQISDISDCFIKNREKTELWFFIQVDALESEYKHNKIRLIKMLAELKKIDLSFYSEKIEKSFLAWFEKNMDQVLANEPEDRIREFKQIFLQKTSKEEENEICDMVSNIKLN